MAEKHPNEYRPQSVSPPGETLHELLEERGMTQADLAARMGRPKKTISEIVRGKAELTPETALQLERVLGVPASLWGNLERNYREHLARVADLARLRKHTDWPRNFPVREMSKLGWIDQRSSGVENVRGLLDFFGVNSVEGWQTHYEAPAVAYRMPRAFAPHLPALAAWLRQGERQAQAIECEPYDAATFRAALQTARELTRAESVAALQTELPALCARSGVAIVFVPEIKGSKACGATRWLSPHKALIQLSLRYKTNDHLWFSFFHEAAHVLLHGKRDSFVEGSGEWGDPTKEREADQFASELLISRSQMAELLAFKPLTKLAISVFAEHVGVAPGIVVGRLQHDGELRFNQLNSLKQRLRWAHESD